MNKKLGEFIRAHRERIKPQDVGLAAGGRRRTPGLRREELAQLCSISPTWLTWLEQGRPVSASGKMLANLADVLQLTVAERAYLFRLVDKLDPNRDVQADASMRDLDAIVKAVNAPAYILNRQWDAVAWNREAQELFVGWLDQRQGKPPPNLMRYTFLEPSALSLIDQWSDRAGRLVAEFRAECGKYADQEPLASLIDELAISSTVFRQLWDSQNVVDREGGTRRFHQRGQGTLSFAQVTLHLATRRDMKLVMLLPE